MTEDSNKLLIGLVVLVVVLSVVFTWKALSQSDNVVQDTQEQATVTTASSTTSVTVGRATVGIKLLPKTKEGA